MSARSSAQKGRLRSDRVTPLLVAALSGAVVTAALTPRVAFAVDGAWKLNGDGNWSATANWTSTPSIPNGVGDAARFLNIITADHTVTQDLASLTLGQIEFNDNNSYLISGSPITLDVAAG